MTVSREERENQISIRPARPTDASSLHAIIQDSRVLPITMMNPSAEIVTTEARLTKQQPGQHHLVAEIGGRVVGEIILKQSQRPRLTHSAMIELIVHPDFWEQSVGSELMHAVLDLADNWLNLQRVELNVFTEDQAALRLCETFGFTTEGVCRRYAYGPSGWMDMMILARLRNVTEPKPEAGGDSGRANGAWERRSFDAMQLTVRPPTPDDAAAAHQIMSHPLVARTTLQMPLQDIARWEERMRETHPGLYRFVADLNGRTIGLATLFQSQHPRRVHSAGLGMSVHPDYWSYGVGSALMHTLMELADYWLNLKRVELDVNTDNPAGIRLYEKFGFEIEGTRQFHAYGDGRWADSYFMARIKD